MALSTRGCVRLVDLEQYDEVAVALDALIDASLEQVEDAARRRQNRASKTMARASAINNRRLTM